MANYKTAIEEFNKELINHPMIQKISEYYSKNPSDAVKILQPRISTRGDRSGNTKEVWINFADIESGITINYKKKF